HCLRDGIGYELIIHYYKPGNYFFGVIYGPDKPNGELFGKCRVAPALNVQIPYYTKDDKNQGFEKIKWINLQATSKQAQEKLSERFSRLIQADMNAGHGGERFNKAIQDVIQKEVNNGALESDKRTDYEWRWGQPGKQETTWPKEEPEPEIPPWPRNLWGPKK